MIMSFFLPFILPLPICLLDEIHSDKTEVDTPLDGDDERNSPHGSGLSTQTHSISYTRTST